MHPRFSRPSCLALYPWNLAGCLLTHFSGQGYLRNADICLTSSPGTSWFVSRALLGLQSLSWKRRICFRLYKHVSIPRLLPLFSSPDLTQPGRFHPRCLRLSRVKRTSRDLFSFESGITFATWSPNSFFSNFSLNVSFPFIKEKNPFCILRSGQAFDIAGHTTTSTFSKLTDILVSWWTPPPNTGVYTLSSLCVGPTSRPYCLPFS